MATHAATSARLRNASLLDVLLSGSPAYWLGVLAFAAPWIRFEVGPWVLYPGHVSITLLLAGVLLDDGGWSAALRPMAPLLTLGAYLTAVCALREDWLAAATVLLVFAGQFAWGAAAMRLGMVAANARALPPALVLLLCLSLASGLTFWAVQAIWPTGCQILNCRPDAVWPYTFTGGWGSASTYAVFLIFLLPTVGGALLAIRPVAGQGRQLAVLLGLTAVAGLSFVAGAPLWALAAAAIGGMLVIRTMGGNTRDPLRVLLRGLVAGGIFTVVLVYGLSPGYLYRLLGHDPAKPPVQLTLEAAPPGGINSAATTVLQLRLLNAGWDAIGGDGKNALRVGARYIVTPERGTSRAFNGMSVSLPGSVAPGEIRSVFLPVRPPHWIRDGYLTWTVESGEGTPMSLAVASSPGFRFINHGFRSLTHDGENHLTPLAARSREFASRTTPTSKSVNGSQGAGTTIGGVLDTLFFSPLWGEPHPPSRTRPLAPGRPAILALAHQYGLIGLGLVIWFGLRLLQRSVVLAPRNDPGWRLLPVTLVLLGIAGLASPVAGSYHALWAFFLLSGYLEGCHARSNPWPAHRPAPRRTWRVRLPIPWRPHAPRRSRAGRAR